MVDTLYDNGLRLLSLPFDIEVAEVVLPLDAVVSLVHRFLDKGFGSRNGVARNHCRKEAKDGI